MAEEMIRTYRQASDVLFRASGRCPQAPAPSKDELLDAAMFFLEESAMRRSSRNLAYRDVADGLWLASQALGLGEGPRPEEFGVDEWAAAERAAAWLKAKVGGK